MTHTRAIQLVKRQLEQSICSDYPFLWIGDIIDEDDNEIWIAATIYAKGENPEDDHSTYIVNKKNETVRLPGEALIPNF